MTKLIKYDLIVILTAQNLPNDTQKKSEVEGWSIAKEANSLCGCGTHIGRLLMPSTALGGLFCFNRRFRFAACHWDRRLKQTFQTTVANPLLGHFLGVKLQPSLLAWA